MAAFTLDSSTLSGDLERTTSLIEDRGRTLQLTWEQAGANQDLEVYGYAVRLALAETQAQTGQSTSFASQDFAWIETPLEGVGSSIDLTWELGGVNQDMEIFGHAIQFAPTDLERQDI